MAKQNQSINLPEAKKISRQINRESTEERWFGYELGDTGVKGTPMP